MNYTVHFNALYSIIIFIWFLQGLCWPRVSTCLGSTKESDLQPLHVAAQEGHTEVARFLVEARARVEASDAEEARMEPIINNVCFLLSLFV